MLLELSFVAPAKMKRTVTMAARALRRRCCTHGPVVGGAPRVSLRQFS